MDRLIQQYSYRTRSLREMSTSPLIIWRSNKLHEVLGSCFACGVYYIIQYAHDSRRIALDFILARFELLLATHASDALLRRQVCVPCVSERFEYMQHAMYVRSVSSRFDALRTCGTIDARTRGAATISELDKVR